MSRHRARVDTIMEPYGPNEFFRHVKCPACSDKDHNPAAVNYAAIVTERAVLRALRKMVQTNASLWNILYKPGAMGANRNGWLEDKWDDDEYTIHHSFWIEDSFKTLTEAYARYMEK